MKKNYFKLTLTVAIILVFITCSCITTQKAATTGGIDYYNIAPEAGKSLVYIARPTTFGFAVPMNVECDGKVIGTNMGKNFIYCTAEPGEHIFTSYAENTHELKITTEPGKVYYVLQKVKMGMALARCELELMDDVIGKSKLKKCNLSKRMPKKE